jgi:uncharacterized protein YndB with AHSA1/START domain
MKSEVEFTGTGIRITRVFEAPRPVVFGWWSSADKLQQWSGCAESTKCEVTMDFRVGGSFTQKLTVRNECEFSHTGTYLEIVTPERIVYRDDFGFAVTHVTIDFSETARGTKVVLTQDGLPKENFPFVAQGISESFEKLEPLLAPVAAETYR